MNRGQLPQHGARRSLSVVGATPNSSAVPTERVLGEVDGWFGLSESPAHGPARWAIFCGYRAL
jgi:hypothetical protein